MSFQFVLLGFLNYGAMTGYDLKKLLDSSTQLFWHTELSQIYPLLKKMEKESLVEIQIQPQSGKPDKKIYSITPAGQAKFKARLSEPLNEIAADKDPVLLKVFFSGALEKEAVLAQLNLQLELRKAYLKRLQGDAARDLNEIIQSTGQIYEGLF